MRPHDITDLALAPVALWLDRRLELLGILGRAELELRVAAVSDTDAASPAERVDGVLRTTSPTSSTRTGGKPRRSNVASP